MRKAFTVVELLVVVGILALLAGIFISSIGGTSPVAEHDIVIKVQEKFPNPLGDGSGEVEYRIVGEDGRTIITYDAALYAGLKKDKSYKVRCEEYSDGSFVVVAILEEDPTQF